MQVIDDGCIQRGVTFSFPFPLCYVVCVCDKVKCCGSQITNANM
jgi:hypothetical protein